MNHQPSNPNNTPNMSDNLMEKVTAFKERLKITGADASRKMSAGMSSMSFKLKELLEISPTTPTPAEKLVEEATTVPSLESKSLEEEVKWSVNLQICDLINEKRIDGGDIIRSVKKRMVMSTSRPRVQYLCMVLLEMLVNNCDKAVSDGVASEGVVDELVKLARDTNVVAFNRDKALMLIRDWKESCCELQYLLYTHEQTYKRLQSRGVTDSGDMMKGSSWEPAVSADHQLSGSVKDPELLTGEYDHGDDQTNTYNDKLVRKQVLDVARNSIELLGTVISSSSPCYIHHPSPSDEELATALVEQCRRSQYEVQRIINNPNKGDDDDDDDALLFEEALNVNDQLHDILSKYDHEDQLRRRLDRNHNEPLADHHHQTAQSSSSSYNKSSSLNQQVVEDDLDEMIFGNK